ncbi:MAG: amidohydrolase family protein, partial [Tunicatimonas sp.]
MKKITWLLSAWLFVQFPAFAQNEIYPVNGVRDTRPAVYLFTNATIFSDYQTRLDSASLLIRDGVVVAVGRNLNAPAGAQEIDLRGKFVYPGLIDLYSDYGLSEVPTRPPFSFGSREQLDRTTEGPYNTNDAIKSQYQAVEDFQTKEEQAKAYRQLGFGAVLTNKRDGLARGTSALVSLSDEPPNKVVIRGRAGAHYSFEKGSSPQYYPISKMGFLALLRQTYLDAAWYPTQRNDDYRDESLEAWIAQQDLPQFFDAPGWMQMLRADQLGDEFGVQYVLRGNGDAYQRLDAVAATNAALIVPLTFPDAYDVSDPYDAEHVVLQDMMHWELAPTNPGRLAARGITFALTADGLTAGEDFWKNLRRAIQHGLSEEEALKALTDTPARLLRAEDQLGSLQPGRLANFIITSDNLFDDEVILYENWIQGKPFTINDRNAPDLKGKYSLEVADATYPLEISGKPGKQKFSINVQDTIRVSAEAAVDRTTLTLSFPPRKGAKERIRLSGYVDGQTLKGAGQLADGTPVNWQATYQGDLEAKEDTTQQASTAVSLDSLSQIVYPFMPYGNEALPEANTYLIRGATVWTNEADGILEQADVLVADGKITQVGLNLSAGGATVIDGSGKHLTSGIIDEHSHIALTSINDIAVNSGMVRMKEVVDSEDINIYRQLAGGVTAAQLLHGSANPIGGQSALVKLRWGASPQEMLIEGADEYIKLALGENVKRSSNQESIRYPQTRMGVEQVYRDAFIQARAYQQQWQDYDALSSRQKSDTPPPRRDLALEAMVEILNDERFITCHSYVQSEINMLMHVADDFDFRVNTFTHILEGYKVADKMAAHGAGGSTFSDWWAYKFEVRYAIPYNAALMTMAGVTTTINSDDAEMARRLNQEAAKSVKYGGMAEEEAWKMVTLNPAKL